MQELHKQYEEKFGMKPNKNWKDETIIKKLEEKLATTGVTYQSVGEPTKCDRVNMLSPRMDRYKELPPPLVKYLEETWGNWLNYMEVTKRPWKEDYGGEGVTILVPEKFSTEWKRETNMQWDNRTHQAMVDKEGNQITKVIVRKDIREKPLRVGIDEVKKWLDLVKASIIDKAHKKGIKLPGLNVDYQEENITREDYTKSLYN